MSIASSAAFADTTMLTAMTTAVALPALGGIIDSAAGSKPKAERTSNARNGLQTLTAAGGVLMLGLGLVHRGASDDVAMIRGIGAGLLAADAAVLAARVGYGGLDLKP